MAGGPRWRAFWAETLEGRDDVIRALAEGGCEGVPGRPFTDADHRHTEHELIREPREVDAAMLGSRERWTRRVFEACPRLQTVAKLGIGVQRMGVAAATDLGILVSNTPVPENYLSVAEQAVGAMIAFPKHFKAADRAPRQGRGGGSPTPCCAERPWGSWAWAGSGRGWRGAGAGRRPRRTCWRRRISSRSTR